MGRGRGCQITCLPVSLSFVRSLDRSPPEIYCTVTLLAEGDPELAPRSSSSPSKRESLLLLLFEAPIKSAEHKIHRRSSAEEGKWEMGAVSP